MNRMKGLLAAFGLAAVLAAGAACSNGEASPGESNTPAASPQTGAPSGAPAAPAPAVGAPAPQAPVSVAGEVRASAPSGAPGYSGFYAQPSQGQAGIWVTGEAVTTVEPDLATLNIGVEVFARTVAEANSQAAQAMDAIIAALRARGIEEKDIKTTSFNIYPRYEYREVVESGTRRGTQELVGYTVTNMVVVKIRDLDAVGQIIDEVATAGGDATRINGISFTVEDPKPFMDDLREAAVTDAMNKAQQFATLTNVSLGKLVFITEVGGSAPVIKEFDVVMERAAMAAPMPSTPISGGELQLRMMVQAIFAID